MKKFLFALFAGLCFSASANHIAGGEVSYRYISDSTGIPHHYAVTVKLYRNNSQGTASLGGAQDVTVTSSCYPAINEIFNRIPGTNPDGGFAPSEATSCIDSADLTIPVSIHIYKGTVILPGPCADFTFGVQAPCCRSNAVDNLFDPDGVAAFYYTTLDNTKGPNNSLVENEFLHVTSLCANSSVFLPTYEKDIDGDSVAFSFSQPLSQKGSPIPFETGYSIQDPLTTLTGISLNPATGVLSFTPAQAEIVVLSIKATEYRYDSVQFIYIPIAETQTDVTLHIADSCANEAQNWSFASSDTSLTLSCFDTIITLTIPDLFLRNSLHYTDFRMVGSDGTPYPIVNAYSNNVAGYANEINLVMFQPLTVNDTMTLYSKTGLDGNSLINTCGFEMRQDSIQIYLNNCHVSLPENNLFPVVIYPNPVQNTLYLDNRQGLGGSFLATILDNTGKVVKHFRIELEANANTSLDVSGLENGMYILELTDGNTLVREKFVRQ